MNLNTSNMLNKIGADIEVFITDNKGNIVSSTSTVRGTKEEPFVYEGYYSVQKDNILGEFNIPPASDRDSFVDNVRRGLRMMSEEVYDHSIEISPAKLIDPSLLDDSRSVEGGCQPHHSAWDLRLENTPSMNDTLLRTAGGHIHLDLNVEEEEKRFASVAMVRLLDLYILIPSLFIADEEEKMRQETPFGSPGKYRETSYGVEYRSLSNFWTTHPDLVRWVYDQVIRASKHLESHMGSHSGKDIVFSLFSDINGARIKNTIEERDYLEAEKLIQEYNILKPKKIKENV